MRKSLGFTAAVVIALMSVTMSAGTAFAAPVASGSVGCKVLGTGKFHPKLTLAGSPGGVKFTFKGQSSGCSSSAMVGSTPVTVTGATITASGFWNLPSGGSGSSCASLTADLLGTLKIKYKWTASTPIAPTTVTTTGGVPWTVVGSAYHFTLPAGATITSSTGSFAPVSPQVMDLTTNIASPCSAGWGPYPTFTFGSPAFFTLN
jgi:hypothetical protein